MPDSPPSEVLLSWRTLDSVPHVRSARWYTIGGICVLAFAAYGLWDGSWTTAILALLIGGMYFLMRSSAPREIDVQITGIGIVIDGTLTPWNLCKDFWILVPQAKGQISENEHQGSELHIAPQKLSGNELVILLPTDKKSGLDPAVVRETLLMFLPERAGMEERVLDAFAKILKL